MIRTCLISSLVASTYASGSLLHAGGEACRAAQAPPLIELAICLDTSGSMNGLIDSARARLWDVVSDLATATPQPKLRVGIVQFGNDGLSSERGWTAVELDLTEDLDLISRTLFAFTTNGGTELVGRAIDVATREMSWTEGEGSLKILFVAGNESADQDTVVRFGEACRAAIAKGIVVNSIYCGAESSSDAPLWKEVALLADGHFAHIDQNAAIVAIPTPFDVELASLSERLNDTYLPYGAHGSWASANQSAQDANAAAMGGQVAAQRCVTKAGGLYSNRAWDLVDACGEEGFKLEEVPADQLPESMRAMTPEQRRQHVATQAAAREAMQSQVTELAAKREVFLAAARANDPGAGRGLDTAVRDAIRSKAAQRGFTFPATPAPATDAPPASAAASSAG